MSLVQRHPNADWPLWKILGAGSLSLGVFGLLIAFLPPCSHLSVSIGLGSIIVGIGVAIWNWKAFSFTSRFASGIIWTAQMFLIGYRAWSEVYPDIWLIPIFISYTLAWFLPGLTPAFSKLFWREQTNPHTRLGRIILGLLLSLAPVAGAIGSSIGVIISRSSGIAGTYLIIGPGFFFIAINLAFIFSFQIWPSSSWQRSDSGINTIDSTDEYY